MEQPKIYSAISKAMGEIGAIGKNSKNIQQGFMYRGIDAIYNALQPVMVKCGIFVVPVIGNPWMYLIALVVGMAVSTVLLGVLKKKVR